MQRQLSEEGRNLFNATLEGRVENSPLASASGAGTGRAAGKARKVPTPEEETRVLRKGGGPPELHQICHELGASNLILTEENYKEILIG